MQYQKLLQAAKDYKREIVSPTPDAKMFNSSTLEGQIEKLSGDLMRLRNSGKGFGDETFDATATALKRAQQSLADYQKNCLRQMSSGRKRQKQLGSRKKRSGV